MQWALQTASSTPGRRSCPSGEIFACTFYYARTIQFAAHSFGLILQRWPFAGIPTVPVLCDNSATQRSQFDKFPTSDTPNTPNEDTTTTHTTVVTTPSKEISYFRSLLSTSASVQTRPEGRGGVATPRASPAQLRAREQSSTEGQQQAQQAERTQRSRAAAQAAAQAAAVGAEAREEKREDRSSEEAQAADAKKKQSRAAAAAAAHASSTQHKLKPE
ncbi:hypothetical protein FPQ18DRAFT_310151 [Pyronema domesticum]|nr:hypothetical protein FPQ18DRAFT_310151 [Pyronema domesticum]